MIASAVSVPHSYADWSELLDMLREKTDDTAVIEAMEKGTIEWQAGVAERFTRKLIDTVNARMNAAVDKFQREISRSGGQESNIVPAIISMRKEFVFLRRVMSISAIPEDDRGDYIQIVINQANNIQSSLEDSAKTERTGKLLSIVRNNKVNNI